MRREQGVAALMRRRAFGLRPVPSLPSRPFGFNPSRLRACAPAALRFACLQGKALQAIPAARCLVLFDAAEPAAPDLPSQRPAAMDGPLANTLALAAAGCADACRPQRWRFLPITSRRTVHGQPARHRYGASTPRLKTCAARCGRAFSPIVGWLTWPASVGEPEKPSCGDAEPAPSPFGAVRPKAVLVSL